MTSWGICLFCFAVLLETFITLLIFLGKSLPRKVLLFSWGWTTMAYTMAVFITIMYWSMLFGWDSAPTYANVFIHGLQVFLLVTFD